MNPKQGHNGHGPNDFHASQQRLLSGIDRAAKGLAAGVDRIYGRWDRLQARTESWNQRAGTYFAQRPARALALAFSIGVVVGAWIAAGRNSE